MSKLEQNYNEIVGITLVNLWTLSDEKEAINFANFDPTNEEHLYVLHVAINSSTIINKPIRFNLPRHTRKAIATQTACERIDWKKRAKNRDAFDTNEVLEFMRPAAKNITQNENFSFADIYHEFYEREEKNA